MFDISKINLKILSSTEYIQDILDIQSELNIHILSKENIIKDLSNNYFKYIIATHENTLVGFASFSYVESVEIESIATKKDFQHLGVATLILNYISSFASKNKIQDIFLEVRKSNIPAQKLYTKNGFLHISTRKNYYSNTLEDAYIFAKKITV